MRVTAPSSWPWIDHLVSGLRPATRLALIRLRTFPTPPPIPVKLATERKSLTHYTKVRRHQRRRLPLFVCMRFQDLFHSPGFFRLPSRYWFTIGRSRVFSLGGWSPIFRQDFTCPALLVARLDPPATFLIRGYHPLWPTFPGCSKSSRFSRAGSSRSLATTWESRLISFPRGT